MTITTEKPIYATDYAAACQRLKSRICTLLQWDEMQYAEYQYNSGRSYLYWYLPCSPEAREQLERSKLYWNWFKKVWKENDNAFCTSEGIEQETLRERLRIYKDLQCPRTMAVEVKPNDVVLAEIK